MNNQIKAEKGMTRVNTLKNRLDSISLLSISQFFFFAFLFMKPFYILKSGSLQIGDMMIVLSFISIALYKGLDFKIEKNDFLLIGFVASVIVINGIYFCIYLDSMFLIRSSFYLFNLMAVLLFRFLYSNQQFLEKVSKVLRLSLYLQLVIFLLKAGRWYDANRYMGTFNDPNQLGFFVLSSLLCIRFLEFKIGKKKLVLDDLVSGVLIFETASTGMLLGLAIYYIGLLIMYLIKGGRWRWPLLILMIASAVVVANIFNNSTNLQVNSGNQLVDFTLERVVQKIQKLNGEGNDYNSSILIDRGLDKVCLYPEKMLLGAGEGHFSRFTLAHAPDEVHSTIIGLLFYYGALPYASLVAWVISNGKLGNTTLDELVIVLPILVESLTLANQRQPIFWILLAAMAIGTIGNNKIEDEGA